MTGSELYDSICKCPLFNETNANQVIKQLFLELNYLYSKGIVHCDNKPSNIMVENFKEKNNNNNNSNINNKDINLEMIDIDLSNYFNTKEKLTNKVGSSLYIAPEVIIKCNNEKCDICSSGIILFVMLLGHFLF